MTAMKINRRRMAGLSLVETMVAITISLILMGGAITLFINNKVTYESTDNMSRLQENARFAIDFMIRDLRMAGYFGCNNAIDKVNSTIAGAGDLVDITSPLEGFDDSLAAWSPSGSNDVVADVGGGTFGDPLDNTDGVTIRRLSGNNVMVTASALNSLDTPSAHGLAEDDFGAVEDCGGADIFQVDAAAADSVDLVANTSREYFTNGDTTDPSNPRLAAFIAVRYYIGTGTNGPSLFRQSVRNGGIEVQELIEGVESMHLLYGVDTDADNVPDTYVEAGNALLDSVPEWESVIAVRIAMLVRTLQEYGPVTETDAADYVLNDFTFTAGGDRFKRRIFNTTVQLRNRLT